MKSMSLFLHSTVFRRFLLSFLAAFVLPITLIFGYMEYTNQKLLTREIYNVQDTLTNYMRRSMDFEYSRCRTFSATLLANTDLNNIRKKTYDKLTPDDALRLMNLRGVLGSFSVDASIISRIFLYFPTANLYVDSVRALPLEDALYTLEDTNLLPADSEIWQAMLNQTYTSQWLSIINQKGNTVLYYMQTLPSAFESNISNLMIAISPAYLREVFNSGELSNHEWIGMTDETGKVIYSPFQTETAIELPQTLEDRGSFIQDQHLFTYCQSKLGKILFINILPLENISSALLVPNSLSYVALLLSFIICTIITYLTTVRNFKPIAYLSTLARPNTEDSEADEFTRLRLSLIEAIDERRLRTDRAAYTRQLLDDQALIDSIMKAGNQAPLDKRLQRDELASVGTSWVLGIVTPVDFSDESMDTQTSYQHAMMKLHDSFGTVGSQFYTVLSLYNDNAVYVLINLPSDELQHLAFLRNAFTNLLQLLRNSFSIDCQISVSAIHSTPALYGQVFSELITEAKVAAESPTEGESILFYSTQSLDKVMQISMEHTMSRLKHACMRGAEEETGSLLKQLSEQIHMLSEHQSVSDKEADPYENESTEMRLKHSILEIVKNEYPDPMLNVSAIADKLGKNVDYISRVFKQTTTIGLLDYIHHMRIKAAKELLMSQPNLSIDQVSQRVGYFGADSFIRSFKRVEGTTPGRFRKKEGGAIR